MKNLEFSQNSKIFLNKGTEHKKIQSRNEGEVTGAEAPLPPWVGGIWLVDLKKIYIFKQYYYIFFKFILFIIYIYIYIY